MNKSKTPTSEKIGIPLRLEPELYEKMMDRVQKEKKNQRGYSVNQLLTELLEKELKEKKI
ncbi:MAG: hypothetical protein IJ262_02980 [Clostridia bacterium]|nr:hypothetical protein [Clostridia bacterium]